MRHPGVLHFGPDFFSATAPFTVIGTGDLGGKAAGLARIQETIAGRLERTAFPEIDVAIPFFTVLATDVFEAFMSGNRLWEVVDGAGSDERLALAFLAAPLPATVVGDLRAFSARVTRPVAVRSSSRLEDEKGHPLAGVYATKMVPCSQLDEDGRFRSLVEAIKLVWASTFFEDARVYRRAAGLDESDERMAVILQEVVGRPYAERFYPVVSGVARSYNYYAVGHARPEDGVVQLALGLGKTIVDGGSVWSYSPAAPKAPPPVNDLGELLKSTQTAFWAITSGTVPYDPARETEYLVRCELGDAEVDGSLRLVASTYDPHADRLVAGTHVNGPRLVDFAPLLRYRQLPLNPMVADLLQVSADELGGPVEIEFAVAQGERGTAHCGFLQVREMTAPGGVVTVEDADLDREEVVVFAEQALGNGEETGVADIVYVRREHFDARRTREIANEIARINAELVEEGRPYLLVGFGRWGTSDASSGVPVAFSQISGARALVEAQTPEKRAELSQGSHFFHNLTSLGVLFLSVAAQGRSVVDWQWLKRQPAVRESELVRHVRPAAPVVIRVDGRTGRGVVLRG